MLADEFTNDGFDLDPAATDANRKARAWYTEADDGLALPWHGKVWLNPPYGGQLPLWLAKARYEVAAGNAELVVCLIPASVGSLWWQDASKDASLIRFWPRRIRFGGGDRAMFDSAVIVYGKLTGRHSSTHKFCAWCREMFWPRQANKETCSDACRQAQYRDRCRNRLSRESVTV